MAVVEELLTVEENGTLGFGNHELDTKAKLEEFSFKGDLYKVKTFQAMTKLEKNGLFLYESVPGTTVRNFSETEKGVTCQVEAQEDAQLIVALEENVTYEIFVDGVSCGRVETKIGGKLTAAMNLAGRGLVDLEVRKQG